MAITPKQVDDITDLAREKNMPNEILRKMLFYIDRDGLLQPDKDIARYYTLSIVIMDLFVWNGTDEGTEFWSKIYRSI